jgi:hypothetical protein
MRWREGQSGNPRGRPRGDDSLAGFIRKAGGKAGRRRMALRMWELATKPEVEPHVAIKAAEWIANHGWPGEKRPDFNLLPTVPLFQLPAGAIVDVSPVKPAGLVRP